MIKIRSLAVAACAILGLCGSFFSVPVVSAQVDTGLQAVVETTGLSTDDPRAIAARIINVSLSVLATILVVIIIYAGLLWMTAGGDPAKTEKARLYIRNAIIGLVIILSSWAIALFVLRALGVGDGRGNISQSGGGDGGGGFQTSGASGGFRLLSITPSGSVRVRNIKVRFFFNAAVDPATVSGSSVRVIKTEGQTPVGGSLAIDPEDPTLVIFTPSDPCPGSTDTCFEGNKEYVAEAVSGSSLASKVGGGSLGGQKISCGSFAPCSARFTTGDQVDAQVPSVSVTEPYDGQGVAQNALVTIFSRAQDDAGISFIDTFAGGKFLSKDAPLGPQTPLSFEGRGIWDTAGIATGTLVGLRSRAGDIDNHVSWSATSTVIVRAAHCFNRIKDADESGLDCGGECGACVGGSCVRNTDCGGGMCVGGKCVEQPVVTGVSPVDGRPGTFVTVSGFHFGATVGKVFVGGVEAKAPAACVTLQPWSSSRIVIAIPPAAISGPLRVVNTVSGLEDTTDNDRGPRFVYTVNDVARPGLCAVVPDRDEVGKPIALMGAGLGQGAGSVLFDDRVFQAFESWSDETISLRVPSLPAGGYVVLARSSGVDSNAVRFDVSEPAAIEAPVIDRLDPSRGPIGEYVTLLGRNFGFTPGTVKFRLKSDPSVEVIADVSFPAACAVNVWRDTSIVVKVPKEMQAGLGKVPLKLGDFDVYVVRPRASGPLVSASALFTVTEGTPKPGLCAIQPAIGPAKTPVILFGERFGADGQVTFQSRVASARLEAEIVQGGWRDQEIKASVPASAVTGNVTVAVGEKISNSLPFQVQNCNENPAICSAGVACCPTGQCAVNGACPRASIDAAYAWRTSTGRIPVNPRVVEECRVDLEVPPLPSPSPWDGRDGGDRACINSDIIVRFNAAINPETVIYGESFIVRSCDAEGENPCEQTSVVKPRDGFPKLLRADGDDQNGASYIQFRVDPLGGSLKAARAYEVYLTQVIRAAAPVGSVGLPMLRDLTRCGDAPKDCAYRFRFRTRTSDELCKVSSVVVTPNPFSAQDIGQKIPYLAHGVAADDRCLTLDASGMEWSWDTARNGLADPRASITNHKTLLGNVAESQEATALSEAVDPPVSINATTRGVDGGTKGSARLTIKFVPPRVVSFGPNCDQACVNAALWAKFNVPMQAQGFTGETVRLQRCANENCRSFDRVISLQDGTISLQDGAPGDGGIRQSMLFVEPTDAEGNTYLEPGRFYKVTLRNRAAPGGAMILSETGLALTGLNDADGFAWIFRVKQGANAYCAPTKVDVQPQQKIESKVGDRQRFAAMPVSAPSACDKNGELLISNKSYEWTSKDPLVARFVDARGLLSDTGAVDTSTALPPACRANCLNAGAGGVQGKVASCGNGRVETTDTTWCRKGSDRSQACDPQSFDCVTTIGAQPCVVLPVGARGGEECDDGAQNNTPQSGCSARCLFQPVKGGTCGNKIIELGEQCDEGGAVFGCTADCQALGASAAQSVCGNGSLGDGEMCEDGNTQDGDGCSSNCLHEGSSSIFAVCGNGVLESGESCERPGPERAFPPGCQTTTCLHVGTSPCADGKQQLCCGNGGQPEPGEDCDYGIGANIKGSGCSSRCLLEGSSDAYAIPSFCGDGISGTGEQCEAAAGDGKVDRIQLSQITAAREPTPEERGVMSSRLEATYESKTGVANHGVQCGYTEEVSCKEGYGLTVGGCCSARPVLVTPLPAPQSEHVCRNVLITAGFSVALSDASLAGNVIVAEKIQADACPVGTVLISDAGNRSIAWRVRVAAWWRSLWSWVFGGRPATAAVWCAGGVSVQPSLMDGGKTVVFKLSNALKANTEYRVVFRGDRNLADALKEGIRSVSGVVADETRGNRELSWSFKTGTTICSVNAVTVKDKTHPPLFFVKPQEAHAFEANALSIRDDGQVVPLSPVNEYAWAWQPWASSEPTVLSTGGLEDIAGAASTTVTAQNKNGSSLIFASVIVTRDDVNTPSTKDLVLSSSAHATVLLCERPWPPRELAPFADQAGSKSLEQYAELFKKGPYYNFSFAYCMDAGAEGPEGDLPVIQVAAVPDSEADKRLAIRRQYLLTFEDPALKKDGIGLRIVANPLHLSPASWYAARGFTGTPEATTLDGYEAVRDGSTLYAATANVDDQNGGPVYSNIFVISRNPDATAATQEIYRQILSAFTFNVNLKTDSQNVCVFVPGNGQNKPAGSYAQQDGKPVACTADWECAAKERDTECSSLKSKLRRDTRRIADMQAMTRRLESYRVLGASRGMYPGVTNGSYLQTITTSLWPSWQGSLGQVIGTALPRDPVNRFLSCGRCAESRQACSVVEDCPNKGEACEAVHGFDPATCWNASEQTFHCPILERSNQVFGTPSRLYQYRALDGGIRYELSTELEGPAAGRYQPALLSEVFRCSNTGSLCRPDPEGAPDPSTDVSCDDYGPDGKKLLSTGTCNPVGGRWLYANLCRGQIRGAGQGGAVCGNGKIEVGEECEVGSTRPIACAITGKPGVAGTKIQVCSDCKGFQDAPSSVCVQDALCGNGRLDRLKCYTRDQGMSPGFRYGLGCTLQTQDPQAQVSAECTDPRDNVQTKMVCLPVPNNEIETCDDGALNGTYGHCRRDCKGYGGICGDTQVSLGETCDNGGAPQGQNGEYCGKDCAVADSCSVDCRGPAPYCGDQIVQAPPEQCDGNTDETMSALCSAGPKKGQVCVTDAQCDKKQGGVCGGDPQNIKDPNHACSPQTYCSNNIEKACTAASECNVCGIGPRNKACSKDSDCDVNGVKGRCGGGGASIAQCLSFPTARNRNCKERAAGDLACTWNAWSACVPTGSCGNAKIDGPSEQCDDGNGQDNDGCTNACQKNMCGDGVLHIDVEQCDKGALNGIVEQAKDEDYGSTRISCSITCTQMAVSGGFCGDRIRNGPEQCDDADFGVGDRPTCQALGYDYSTNVLCKAYDYCLNGDGTIYEVYKDGPFEKPCPENQIFLEGAGENARLPRLIRSPRDREVIVPSDISSAVCRTDAKPILACGNTCSYAGCANCQDEKGKGEISGRVMDAVYTNQPVPGARVSLFSKGVKVGEVITNVNGDYVFKTLNTRPECSSYRLIVDFFGDNPCTNGSRPDGIRCGGQSWNKTGVCQGGDVANSVCGEDGDSACWGGGVCAQRPIPDVDEGINGGYWPYESSLFSLKSFYDEGIRNQDGRIYLVPRVGKDETLVVFNWDDDASGWSPRLGLVVPELMTLRYCVYNQNNKLGLPCPSIPYAICSQPAPSFVGSCPAKVQNYRIFCNTWGPDWQNDPLCFRRIGVADASMRRNFTLNFLPWANVHCYKPDGTDVPGCNNRELRSQSMRFVRKSELVVNGRYSAYVYLEDQNKTKLLEAMRDLKATVRVVTENKYIVLTPPRDNKVCENDLSYWLLFQEESRNGAIEAQNTFLCAGDPTPNENAAMKLPAPLY